MKVEDIVKIRANNVSTIIALVGNRKVPIMVSTRRIKARQHKPKLNTWSQVLRFWFDLT